MRKKIQKADIVIAAVLLVAAVSCAIIMYLNKDGGKWVSVRIDGVESEKYSLRTDGEYWISSENGYNILSIHSGVAEVLEADCKNQICVDSNPISKVGEVIVCLPHEVVFVIE